MAITIDTASGGDVAGRRGFLRGLTRGWNTPRWIRSITAGVLVVALALGIVVGAVMTTVRDGFAVIGGRAAPLVAVSADLHFALSDMDAQVANVLLVGNDPGMAGNLRQAMNTYDQRRTEADGDLQDLASVGASDATVQGEVGAVLGQLGRYEALTGEIFLLEQRDASPAGEPAGEVLALYRQDTDMMSDVLTSVQYLTDSNHELLNSTYLADRSALVAARVWVAVLGVVLVLFLVVLQGYLRSRMRRRINPALLVATVVSGLLTVAAFVVLSGVDGHLTLAKSNAFDSIVGLSQARAVSHDARADQSRYLVDPGRAAQYQDAFVAKSLYLADLPGADVSTYDAKLGDALQANRGDRADIRFGGYFGAELHNITLPGESAAADRMLALFQTYERDDRHLRGLNVGGDLRGAVTFNVGTTPGNSDYDFGQYDTALGTFIGLNQQAFDGAISEANNLITGWTGIIPTVAVLLIGGLTVVGMWPRLAEYR